MSPLWAPLSAIHMDDPPVFASVFLVRRLLARRGRVELLCSGDRMWPAIRHGQRIVAEPLGGEPLKVGQVVLAALANVPEALRVIGVSTDGVMLRADADPEAGTMAATSDLLGRIGLPVRRVGAVSRTLRRLLLDAGEALLRGPDPGVDAGASVLAKYDAQAPFYRQVAGEEIPADLLASLRRHVPAGGRVLVAGCGTGRECFALAQNGWMPVGVDFSPAMLALAREEARRLGLQVEFHEQDLRKHQQRDHSLDAILFSYDVYSFIPGRAERTQLLAGMARWLRPGGIVLLSARQARGIYDRLVVTLQQLSLARKEERNWGASHTRWIAPDGTLHRSFVKVFTEATLGRELKAAGFTGGRMHSGHLIATPAGRAT